MGEYCRILIVDDEYIMRRGIRYMIDWEEQGFQIVGEASNGKEALDLMLELKPHIVFCDIAMPVMDGIDFVRVAHKKYPDVQILILSGYDKFEYVRQALINGAVDYILKPTLNPEELCKILGKMADRIPGMRLKKKDVSTLENQLECYLKDQGQELNIQEVSKCFPHSCYRVLGLPMKNKNTQKHDFSQIIFEKALQYLEINAPGTYFQFLYNPEFLCIVLNYPLKDEEMLRDVLREMMNELALIDGQVFAVLGKVHKKLADVKEDFINNQFLELEAFYHKGIYLYEIDEKKELKKDFQKFNFRYFSVVITDRKYGEAAEMFQDYIEKAVESQMSEFKLKNQTKNLLYNLIGSVDGKIQSLEQIRYEYFGRIDECICVEEFQEIFKELIEALKECLGENSENQDEKLQEILKYIAENYQDEMDLSSLAQKFNFNYSYLSTYFTSRMGEGFSEYLNRIRIGHACEYLEKGELSIAAISEAVGYSDQGYFGRVFKKITGETPSVYRRRQRSGKW